MDINLDQIEWKYKFYTIVFLALLATAVLAVIFVDWTSPGGMALLVMVGVAFGILVALGVFWCAVKVFHSIAEARGARDRALLSADMADDVQAAAKALRELEQVRLAGARADHEQTKEQLAVLRARRPLDGDGDIIDATASVIVPPHLLEGLEQDGYE